MKFSLFLAAIAVASSALNTPQASAASLTALSTFGGGDGWLAPGEGGYAYLGTGNNERGLAYGNNHLYLVSRANVAAQATNIRILDSSTGADLGGLNITGITGGTFTVNTVGVGGDGAIYVNNLATTSGTANFKVYSWATEASAPTAVYNGTALLGARVGDSMAVNGSGSSTRIAVGYSNAPVIAGNNGYGIIDPTAGTHTSVGFTGTPPAAGDFRLGLTFSDASHVLGSQGSSLYRYTSFSGSTGTLIGSPAIPDPSGATADRLLAATVVGGVPLLAVQSTGDGHVSIYDITNPASPLYLTSGLNIVGSPAANANGTGQLSWGPTVGTTATLYAMSTNSGIQAFTFTLPEPASLSVLAGLGVIGLRRRK
jgi:hypothetical protein